MPHDRVKKNLCSSFCRPIATLLPSGCWHHSTLSISMYSPSLCSLHIDFSNQHFIGYGFLTLLPFFIPAQPTNEKDKGCTKREFADLVRCLLDVLQQKCRRAGIPIPKFLSFDNASNHDINADVWTTRGLERVPLSTHSPDIHKVIEHTFARFKTLLHQKIFENFARKGVVQPSMHEVRRLIEEALHEVAKPATIAADQKTLPVTLQIIKHDEGQRFRLADGREFEGSGGNWPPKGFR